MKKGLVLEGGAMRGMFTCGVLDVLMENNITFDGAVGVSAGACFGVNIKSGQIGRAIRYNVNYAKDPRYGSWASVFKTGNMFDADFCYHDLHLNYDVFDIETFKQNPMTFYCVATDIDTGKPVYHQLTTCDYTDLEWIRASAAMPIVSQYVELEGHRLLDGGVSDAIPLSFLESKGFNHNLVILTQPRSYQKEKSNVLPLIHRFYPDCPHLLEDMENRHIRYNKTTHDIWQKADAREIFVIAPPQPLNIKANESDRKELIRVYEIGRMTAHQKIDDLKKYMQEAQE